ncbi:hypothetical protein COT66_00290 [Candidatus Shapirobacteria bacterium CG09_land_8_20_14_0_10_49_15]|uniref:Mannosyl-glycoprotein endo-beta-N-acetylglucosamidase-like domain-containing protein n=2 Tax=Candidatus Shapironibacteriota TaxID=1752721 RepID=A0A2M8L7M2_9BACT|nr:MAG: hypothetical protein COT66_00290 [Candidatus Shapirobacteria bacterium CG09_land_8_20_14_0_10_49_15]PJE70198.1 MAG: hypothetical protein COU97_00910 [Candidatus Shapirobacteria bacterium CG10_big_fil_rev_8_21_14_0_10_48_15]
MKKFILVFVFLFIAPVNLTIGLLSLAGRKAPAPSLATNVNSPSQLYAALPQASGQALGTIDTADARPVIIQKYLEKYHSPLAPLAGLLVATSDQYGLDWRLLVAIAQQESNLGKKIPPDSYNAWGWGIHSRGTLKFASWEQAIETVAQGLKEKYLDQGYITPEEIMNKYTPLSDGSWAAAVSQFFQELETGQVD